MASQIRIAVVDPYPIFREGISRAIRKSRQLAIVAEGATSEDARRIAEQSRPDLLLLDISVPGDGIDVVRGIVRDQLDVKVIIVTALDDEEHVIQAIHAGARGYVLKGVSGSDLITIIEAVHGGKCHISPDLAWRLLEAQSRPLQPVGEAAQNQDLSVREEEILGYSAQGLTNIEIAIKLGLTVRTIKHYKTLAFRKMGVRNRIEAMLEAQKKSSRNGQVLILNRTV